MLQMPDVFPFDRVDNALGDVDRMIRYSFEGPRDEHELQHPGYGFGGAEHVSHEFPEHLVVQIVHQVKYLVASGRLGPGDELPPIRVLAEQLLINPNTVARAYRELEVGGLLTKRQGAGTYVSDGGSPLARRERLRILTERVDALLAEAHQMKFDVGEVVKLVREREGVLEPIAKENASHE